MSLPMLDLFENIIDPQNHQRWTLVRAHATDQAKSTYMLNPDLASDEEKQYYEFRAVAHGNGLTEQDFAARIAQGEFPAYSRQFRGLKIPNRSERAQNTSFQCEQDLLLSRVMGKAARCDLDDTSELVPSDVLVRRLETCGLSVAGSDTARYNRLRDHVYAQTPTELLKFAVSKTGQDPSSKSKRELFNMWHQADPQTQLSSSELLDAWHHSPGYTTSDDGDVSDMALQSRDFEQLLEFAAESSSSESDDRVRLALQHALREDYLKSVLEYHGFQSENLDASELRAVARELSVTAGGSADSGVPDRSLGPHWETVVRKVRDRDVKGALFSLGRFSFGGSTEQDLVSDLKRRFREARSKGELDQVKLSDTAVLESFLDTF